MTHPRPPPPRLLPRLPHPAPQRFYDFEGRSDGRAMRDYLARVAPRRLALVRGGEAARAELAGALRHDLADHGTAVYTPGEAGDSRRAGGGGAGAGQALVGTGKAVGGWTATLREPLALLRLRYAPGVELHCMATFTPATFPCKAPCMSVQVEIHKRSPQTHFRTSILTSSPKTIRQRTCPSAGPGEAVVAHLAPSQLAALDPRLALTVRTAGQYGVSWLEGVFRAATSTGHPPPRGPNGVRGVLGWGIGAR